MHCKEINLTVVADRTCSTSLAYLEYLYRFGYKPKKIYLCSFLYRPSLCSLKERILYNAPWILKKFKNPSYLPFDKYSQKITDEIQSVFDFKIDLNLNGIDYTKYTQNIENITVWNYKDPCLQKKLFQDPHTYYLYTNGGIVPKNIFDKKIKILHVHPGIVPYVKGSDGLLWSLLIREKLGYSCFFMDSGIDTGDIIDQKEFDPIIFPKLHPLYENYSLDLYALFLRAFDPHFRAEILASVIHSVGGDLMLLQRKKQNPLVGREFFSMHPLLIKKCLKKFF